MRKIQLLAALALGLTACGGTTSTPTPTAPTINVSGKWVATLSGGVQQVFRFTLNQDVSALSGDAEIAYFVGQFVNLYNPFGKLSGTVSGDQFSFTATGTGQFGGTVTLNGTRVADQLTGNWSGTNPQGAAASGTFTAKREP